MDWVTAFSVLDSTIRLTTPLLLACLAGLYAERAGVFDISIEGKMLFSAFAAGVAATALQSSGYGQWAGLVAAILVGMLIGLLHGFASISMRGNQIVSGVAINFLAVGLTSLLAKAWYKEGGKTPQLPNEARFEQIDLPFAAALRDVPVIGPVYSGIVSGHSILVYAAFAAVPLTWWVIFRTRFGLRLRAVGENPAAVDTAGISVNRLRYGAVMICGALSGVAGAYLSIAQSANFAPNMTAGKGFIALAALIFAKWKPVPALGACLLFGFLEAVAIPLQSQPLFGVKVPSQFINALPYILTVVLLAGFIGKAIPPKAGGVPYVKER
jgi:general nucleoside transport system permease protein